MNLKGRFFMDHEIEPFKKDFSLFIEAGFVAAKQTDEVSSTNLFRAAKELNSEHVMSDIGLGYIALNKLEVKQATKIFEDVVKKEPENYLAQTLLGVSYLLVPAKRSKGETLIKEAMSKTDDETIADLGKVSLEWSEKELKKKDSPFTALAKEQEDK
jgi:lipopolysaccharide biosynthesis regulator YciM